MHTIVMDTIVMDTIVLDNIPFRIETDRLAEKLRIGSRSRHLDALKRLIDEAQAIARPRALYERRLRDHRGYTIDQQSA